MRISDWSSDVCSSDLYSPSRYWYDQGMSEVEAVIDKIDDELDDLEDELSLDKWDWIHALETPILDLLESKDTRKPEDLLDSYDKCEVVFLFKRQGYAKDRKSTRVNSSH